MTKTEAIDRLADCDHLFLKKELVDKITEPFGFSVEMEKHYDTRSEFKGLTLGGINPITGKKFAEGDYAYGIDASKLAELICEKQKVSCPDMFGRGSQLRACIEALRNNEEKNNS